MSAGESQHYTDMDWPRMALGLVVMVFAGLMIVGFGYNSWMDFGEFGFFGGAGDDPALQLTALEIWIGENDGQAFTFNIRPDAENGGFADVRLLDRFLILVPLGAVLLLAFAWEYVAAADREDAAVATARQVIAAIFLLALPFAWEIASEWDWNRSRGDTAIEASVWERQVDEGLVAAYSTGEQKVLGGLALVVALGAFFRERNRLRASGGAAPVPPPDVSPPDVSPPG